MFNFSVYLILYVVLSGIVGVNTVTPSPTPSPSSVRSSLNFITTVAGTGATASSGTGGLATAAALNTARGVWVDTTGFLFFSEANGNCIRGFSLSDNIVTNVGGICGLAGYSGNGGLATNAKMDYPSGIYGSSTGNLYVADNHNCVIRRITSSYISLTVGTGAVGSTGDGGQASASTLNSPMSVAVDSTGKLYISTTGDSRVRALDNSNIIWLFSGTLLSLFFCLRVQCLQIL